jgi:hypothetical protein
MALLDFLRPDYPTFETDTSGTRATWAVRGLAATINPLLPNIGDILAYGGFNYIIEKVSAGPLATSTYADYLIMGYYSPAKTEEEVTDEQYPQFSIDYVQVEKALKQHPEFAAFTADDWVAVTTWDEETDSAAKADLQYYARDKDGKAIGSAIALTGTATTGQIGYATLRLKGVESFLDFAPEVTYTSKYFSTTPPSAADAGQKVTAPSYAPSGYEWLKIMDRVTKTGTRSLAWIREEKWLGARKVLLDKDEIFS